MTLRELVQEVSRINGFDTLASKISDIHPEWNKTEGGKVLRTYKRVAREIEDLPGDDELKGHMIALDHVENTLFNETESWVDVHLLDEDGDKWSIDMTDWNGLVDLPVKDNACDTLTERLAHILYEITFWGVTRKSVLHECEQMRLTAKDKDNLIEVSMEEFLAEVDTLK